MTPLSPSLWGVLIGMAAAAQSFEDYEKTFRLPHFTRSYTCAKEAVILESVEAPAAKPELRRFKVLNPLKGKRYKAGDEIDLEPSLTQVPKPGMKYWHTEGPLATRGPVLLTPGSLAFVEALPKLPEKHSERLAVAWKYYNSGDPGMRSESLGLIATVPHAELFAMKAQLKSNELLAALDASINIPNEVDGLSRLLAVCGTRDDLPAFKKRLQQTKCNRDELWVTYAVLRGPEALDDFDRWLADPQTDFHYAIQILGGACILGQISPKSSGIPRDRILQTLYGVIEDTNFSQKAIDGLRRLKDWKATDRLVELFYSEDHLRTRTEVLTFLSQCPAPEAKKMVEELKEADPKAWQFYLDREARFVNEVRKLRPE